MRNKIKILLPLAAAIILGVISLAGCSGSNPAASSGGGGVTIPAAPVASLTVGNTQNTISWATVSGATSYNIYWTNNVAASTTVAASGTKIAGVTSPHPHTSLINGTTYYYVVTAANSAGESSPSNMVNGTPSGAAPPAPTITNFTPSSGSVGTGVTITGTNFSTTIASNSVTFNGTTAVVTAANATTITTSVPAGATTGPITVTVNGQAAISAASFTVVGPPPSAPTGITASTSMTTSTINWSAAAGATSYNIYFATNSTGSTAAQIKAGGTQIAGVTSPYNHNPVSTNTKYSYVVTAVNTGGESGPSAVVSVMPNSNFINATLFDAVGGVPAAFGNNAFVSVFNSSGAVSNATVMIGATSLPYNASQSQYNANIAVTPGSSYTLSVTIPGDPNTYTATATMFSTYPVITSPTNNFVWNASVANTVNWTQGSPTTGAPTPQNAILIVNSSGALVFPIQSASGGGGPLQIPLATTYTIPAASIPPGTTGSLLVGISRSYNTITNIGGGGGFWVGGFSTGMNGIIN